MAESPISSSGHVTEIICSMHRVAAQQSASKGPTRKLSARAVFLQQLKADAARTTACLEGTAFLHRNRAAFEKSLNARATAAAAARAAAEARLSHSKRVDRSSVFVSDATNDGAPAAQCAPLPAITAYPDTTQFNRCISADEMHECGCFEIFS